MNNYDPVKFTQRFVFEKDTDSNTLSTSNDYNDHIRPTGSTPPGFQFDMLDYLTNGAGRYAIPSVFPIIDNFFNTTIVSQGRYSLVGWAKINN